MDRDNHARLRRAEPARAGGRALTLALALMAALGPLACGDTGQARVALEVIGRGAASPTITTLGGWEVTLSEAEVAVGPIYLCASAAASADLCPSAVAELADAAAIDALDPASQALGEGEALSGETVRSLMLDYGIPWLTTQSRPQPTAAAPGGHSARFVGRAVQGDLTIDFVAEVDVVSSIRGAPAIEGIAVSATTISDSDHTLEIVVDPLRWLQVVDFDELAALPPVPGEPVAIVEGMVAYNAIALAMGGAPPQVLVHE